MGKWFAVTLVLIAMVSAIPIAMHSWGMPENISTHGHAIDQQMRVTLVETGALFVIAQLLMAGLVWKFADRKSKLPIRRLPGGARALVIAAILLVGTEVVALGIVSERTWSAVYLTPASRGALQVEAQAEQFAYSFRYPGADGKFGPVHLDKIDDANQNFFGLDTTADPDSRDDIVTAQLAVPVNREVHLLMHSRDVGHSFYVPELRIQQDFVPGLDLSIHFTATKTGKYEIVCTQLCGLGHYNMRSYLLVLPAEEFEEWLKQKAAAQ